MKNSRLIFIDDSGDPGLKDASTDFLVMAAVIFDDPYEAGRAAKIIRNFKKHYRMRSEYELKFHKLQKTLIKEILLDIDTINFSIAAVYFQKDKSNPPKTNRLYEQSIVKLLKNINVNNALVHIDGRANKDQVRKSKTYLRQELNKVNMRARDIKFENSATSVLTQLADLIVGSIRRQLEIGKTDNKVYFSIIQQHVESIQELRFDKIQ